MLKKQVERKIDGIIVLHAEKALSNFDESFIVQLARSKAEIGWMEWETSTPMFGLAKSRV